MLGWLGLRVDVSRSWVGQTQQDVGVAWLIEWAEADEVMAGQLLPDLFDRHGEGVHCQQEDEVGGGTNIGCRKSCLLSSGRLL